MKYSKPSIRSKLWQRGCSEPIQTSSVQEGHFPLSTNAIGRWKETEVKAGEAFGSFVEMINCDQARDQL